VDDRDAWGVSVTMLAAFAGYGEIARLLLEKGADPNVDQPGFTALHCAIMRRDEATVAALLSNAADPNVPVTAWTPTRRSSDDYHFMPALGMGGGAGWVPVDRASREGLILETVRLAVELGADVHASGIDGRTALDSAKAQKYDTVVAYLQSR